MDLQVVQARTEHLHSVDIPSLCGYCWTVVAHYTSSSLNQEMFIDGFEFIFISVVLSLSASVDVPGVENPM